MTLLSQNAFELGTLLFLSSALTILVYAWLCSIWKVKIIEVTILSNPWFSLSKNIVGGVKYNLGWLPTGTSITPLGVLEEEFLSLPEDERFNAFRGQSKFKQSVIRRSPSATWLLLMIIAYYAVNIRNNDIYSNAYEVEQYCVIALKTLLMHSLSHEEFLKYTKEVLKDKSITIFAFILIMNLQIIAIPINWLFLWIASDNKKTIIRKFATGLALAFMFYVIFWRIPSFTFSFFTWQNAIRYILSAFLGIYLAAIIAFFIVLLNAKRSNSQ
ncbi:hypothetical protein [Mucilaginibacter sp.]|jgi:hypothetical protein|uniref:hypothetical protein n=1 Tax=Mucilaginibacter sp. TaxID=1882438 RepID=UPI002C075760|nr:hypothetical protein [Mucilaginibacter sp.]HTI60105.1 hypothetical protein [Mucilaginibacter sp.]